MEDSVDEYGQMNIAYLVHESQRIKFSDINNSIIA